MPSEVRTRSGSSKSARSLRSPLLIAGCDSPSWFGPTSHCAREQHFQINQQIEINLIEVFHIIRGGVPAFIHAMNYNSLAIFLPYGLAWQNVRHFS